MSTYVPLISSGTAGPLGALHLPRLWQKLSLEAAGKLAPGYPGCGKGYDGMTLAALGLSEEATKAFIKSNKPTYPQFEAWVKQNGTSTDAASVAKHNAAISGYIHDGETRAGIFAANGLTDETCAFRDAVNLNNIDDWFEFHQAVLK